MSLLSLGRGLKVDPTKLATQVVAALGMRGSGKSNSMAVIAEGLLAAKIPVVVLDYVGIWFSLRLQPDGKTPSPYKIPVLGGMHGDISMQPTAGKLVAEALAKNASSAVLDVSGFTKGDRCRFAADFAETFFHVKKSHSGPVFLLLEEAQRFVPQKMHKGQGLERMLGAFEEIAEVGRNYGIGMGLMSQRPQKINKDVLNLTELLFAFQSNGVHERKAIADWVQQKGADGRSEVHNELPALTEGNALVWSPSWLRIYAKHKFHMKSTYDAGATPTHARASVKTKPLDLAKLESSMATVVEQAKDNDPKALKAKIRKLERELSLKRPPGSKVDRVVVRDPFVPPEVKKLVDGLNRFVATYGEAIEAQADWIKGLREDAWDAAQAVKKVPNPVTQTPAPRPSLPPPSMPSSSPPDMENGQRLPKGAQKMLQALATSYVEGLTRRQVATLAGMKFSGGTFAKYLSILKTGQYVTVQGQLLKLTEKGVHAAGPVDAPMGGKALLDHWCAKLPGKTRDMLRHAVDHGPVTREGWADAVGVEASGGTFAKYLSILVTRGLVEKRDGQYVASHLFNE